MDGRRATFLRDVGQRKPVPGMSTLYAGLQRGADGRQSVPFFYVSTGSWNLYDYLVSFMNLHRFPRGPLFLTDWGPNSDRLVRDGREHKRARSAGSWRPTRTTSGCSSATWARAIRRPTR